MVFFELLKLNNAPLFYFGLICFAFAALCAVMARITAVKVMGVNAYIKPLKFFLSVAIFSWPMGFYMRYLDNQVQVAIYTVVLIAGMSFELAVIFLQAIRGRQSHFNVGTPLDAGLFAAMGIVIVIVNLWTVYIGYLFFEQSSFLIPMAMVWAIRLGIFMSALFAFQGGMMAARLRHTIGGNDDEPGLPLLNWSRRHGDLRIAHFLGIHALQAIPLMALLANSPAQVFAIAGSWFTLVIVALARALAGKPFF
jgi:hypothetical protein